MHVVIDACCLGRRKTGNETYVRGLLQGLAGLQEKWQSLDTGRPRAGFRITVLTTDAHAGERQDCFQWSEIPLGNFVIRNFFTIPATLRRLRADLFHASYWTRFWSQPCPSLLMVHDLSFVSFARGFKRHEQFIYANLVRACAGAARHLVTVSEFSKSELQCHWGIPAERISVTYNGVGTQFVPPRFYVSAQANGADPYILAVGNLHPRKNLVRLLEAFVLLKREHEFRPRLKIVGQASWLFDEIFNCVRQHSLENQVEFTGYLSEHDLVAAYQNAELTVYPSLYEGFGLPPLEAMACGSPVVCSSAASLPEICGGAAVLVSPETSESIAEGILKLMTDSALRRDLRIAGEKRAAQFTWEQCAEATLAAYRKALAR